MRRLCSIPLISILLLTGMPGSGQAPDTGSTVQSIPRVESKIEFDRLVSTQGDVFVDVKILKIEPDSLLVEHRGGVSRVSLFDLPDDLRNNYGFNPERAMAHYKERDAKLRSLRRMQFEERLRVENEKAQQARREAFDEDLRRNWIHCRARIVEMTEDGALAHVDRITMKRTRSRTALGGEGLPGPPKLSYSPLTKKPVLLRGIAKTADGLEAGSTWTGYIRRDPKDAMNLNREAAAPHVYQTAVLSRSK